MITPDVSAYLEQSLIPLRLSCVTPSGWPVVLSLWYLHRDGRLYCATQERAKVVSYLRHEPRCAFEVASDQPPYCGVRGQARAVIDGELGLEILRQLLLRIPADDLEQQMEALRTFKQAHLLRVAASEVTEVLPLMKVSDYLTWLAESILNEVVWLAWNPFAL